MDSVEVTKVEKRSSRFILIAALAVALFGCGGDTTGVSATLPSALVGTWVANSSCSPGCGYILTSVSNPNASVDLVATKGLSLTLGLQSNGAATLSLFGSTETGTARVEGSTLYLSSGGSTDTIDYTATGTTLDLQFRTQVQAVDFNGDQQPDLARQHAVLRKK